MKGGKDSIIKDNALKTAEQQQMPKKIQKVQLTLYGHEGEREIG
uniref:Uncharacterized protein n=1 Tax=Arundo donax TaxID=35708 RepID=A0A0A9GLA9_ARUDO